MLKDLGAGLREEDFSHMGELIDELIQQKQEHTARETVRTQAWQCVGEGAKRTADYMISKYQELTGNKE